MRSEVVVVGAGFGGLASAIELAASGASVTVLEAKGRAGGKAGVVVHDGVRIDTGPSVLTLPEVFDAVFRRAGTTLEREVGLVTSTPAFRYLWPDGARVDVFHDVGDTVDSVRESLGAKAAAELGAFLEYARGIWDSAAPHFVYGPAPSMGTLLSLGTKGLGAVTRIDSLRTMRSSISSRVREPHLAMLLERYATYNGSDPRSAPATLNCIAHVELARGFFGVEGGIEALVAALVRVAMRLGVRFRYDSPVARIETSRRRVNGVTLADGVFHRADAVVANADVAHVARDLLSGTRGSPVSAPRQPSMSGYTLAYRALRRSGGDRPAHTVLFPERYDEEFEDIFTHDRAPKDPTVYLCAQEKAHRRPGWTDHEPLFVMVNAPPEPREGHRDAAEWRALEGRIGDRVRAAGLVEDEDVVVWRRSPGDLAREFPGSRGAIYGAASNGKTSAFSRPGNRVAKLPGLYLASGGAHPGGGMPLCMQSGRAAADAIRSDLGLPEGATARAS